MKRLNILLIIIIAITMRVVAQEYRVRHDSVWVYNSWESIMEQQPDTLILNPDISAWTPYDIEFDTGDKNANKMLKKQTVAVAIGDTTWLISTHWLKNNFKGDAKKMDDYTLLFFNAKLAFVQCIPSHTSIGMTLLGSLLGDPELFSDDPYNNPADFYWLDFENKRVEKIDHKTLSRLLSVYPDLQRRFEQMADYKERYMVQSFFLDFVNRAERDPNYPFLIERLNPVQPIQ